MQHIFIKINFHNFEPFTELVYDPNLATNPNKADDLARFICSHYSQDWSKWSFEQMTDSSKLYQNMINEAIKSNNLIGLETLWQGIYFHDRDNPDYEFDVYTAVEFSNLIMLQHIFYGYMNYMSLNPVENLEYYKLKELAAKNPYPEIFKFIQALTCCVDSDNKIGAIDKYSMEHVDEDEDDEFKKICALGQKLYECVETFTPISV